MNTREQIEERVRELAERRKPDARLYTAKELADVRGQIARHTGTHREDLLDIIEYEYWLRCLDSAKPPSEAEQLREWLDDFGRSLELPSSSH